MSIYDRVRHGKAPDAATAEAVPWEPERLRGRKYCLLVTYRRDGRAVPTPVWFGVGDGRLYVRTEAPTAKVKRVRRDPRARVAPCSVRGKPLGPPMEGVARLLEGEGEQRAERAIASNYGLFRRLYERFVVGEEGTCYLEVSAP